MELVARGVYKDVELVGEIENWYEMYVFEKLGMNVKK
jgi:hypothetical protein